MSVGAARRQPGVLRHCSPQHALLGGWSHDDRAAVATVAVAVAGGVQQQPRPGLLHPAVRGPGAALELATGAASSGASATGQAPGNISSISDINNVNYDI